MHFVIINLWSRSSASVSEFFNLSNKVFIKILSVLKKLLLSLIFDIPARYEIDFTRLLIQSLIILVLLGATYTNSYSRFISYMKSSETIELDQSQSKLFFVICLCLAIIVAGLTFRYYILD